MTMILEEHRPDDQVFSYYHGDEMLHFNVTLLARIRKAVPSQFRLITMDIDQPVHDMIMNHRGIEENKVRALDGKRLREPGYGVILEDGSFTIVDGHHRLVRRYRGNVKQMDFWVTDKPIWGQCLVHYPKEFEALLAADIPPKTTDGSLIASAVLVHGRNE
jgi:hypothetical protein